MASAPSLQEPSAQPRPPAGLSFGDGFQFGCGFFTAGLIATFIVVLVLLLVALVLSVTGFGLLDNLLG